MSNHDCFAICSDPPNSTCMNMNPLIGNITNSTSNPNIYFLNFNVLCDDVVQVGIKISIIPQISFTSDMNYQVDQTVCSIMIKSKDTIVNPTMTLNV